jgi:prepilin-type processing-associated H-X9-DG protein
MVLGAVPAARGAELPDFSRHRLRVNVVFCDGHARADDFYPTERHADHPHLGRDGASPVHPGTPAPRRP